MRLKVGLLGGGSWGTTVASLMSKNADITVWARDPGTVDEINRNHTNEKYLPGAKLHDKLFATTDIEEAVKGKEVIVMAIPSHNFRQVLEQIKPYITTWAPIISLTKGLELTTDMRMSQIINEEMPGHPAGILTGPNLAREVIAGSAAASVIAMDDPVIMRELQKLFHSGLFRVYTNHDVIGCELGGVLKNIVAIAAGMGDGMGAGDNTRSAVITRGLAETMRLGVAMGGEVQTFSGLAGVGDLIATCTSSQSRNRTVGYELGRGRTIDEIINEMFMVAEGVKSAAAVMDLSRKYNIEMPIADEVYHVVKGERLARHAYRSMVRFEPGAESQPG